MFVFREIEIDENTIKDVELVDKVLCVKTNSCFYKFSELTSKEKKYIQQALNLNKEKEESKPIFQDTGKSLWDN